jgi:flagellin
MRINSNAETSNNLRTLQESRDKMKASMEKLSSGIKINRASDDPSGLIISEKMRSQIASIEQKLQNIDQADNKLTTAEANLDTLQTGLQDIRKTALAAANEGGNSPAAQDSYQQSIDDAVKGYNSTRETAAYGSQKLLDGSTGSAADVKPLANIDISTADKAQESISLIDEKIKEIAEIRSDIGATQKNDLDANRSSLQTELSNLTASESTIRDTDMAREYTNTVIAEMQLKAGLAMQAHQKQVPNLVLNFLGD